jgi:hypothetical protein
MNIYEMLLLGEVMGLVGKPNDTVYVPQVKATTCVGTTECNKVCASKSCLTVCACMKCTTCTMRLCLGTFMRKHVWDKCTRKR